ncbi:unnamed protein product [Caenorhabditis angaria]|uniref:Alpha-mannosidase n=1 Tax=Caenorhabditis angaria TaxID=860376 RepID=A0A9P1NAT5_9PELO|nr:unnamed protein product [Caenorhabditis angaria]
MIVLLFYFLVLFQNSAQDCSWNTCQQPAKDSEWITAHLIPHTHDDLGWIKTVDQYYYGARPDLVPVGVQYIYNTVIDELLKNPERKFSFAETGFLWRWYDSNSDFDKHQLQKLVKNGQIEIIGGGWVQNDEAASHYVDIIDQMTLGLQKLEQIFGECGKPQTGWQIDPFGHSKEMANIYSQMGYSNLYFARIHYLEKELRLKNKTLEFVWQASEDIASNIFTGAFFQDNYGPPEGFCWDALCGDDPIMDNINLEEFNVAEKVEKFVAHVKNQAAHQKHNHVMLLMGSDFQYTNANSWYSNLDKLIKYVNAEPWRKVKVIYSTPTCYSNAVKSPAFMSKITRKSDDFFPYASAKHSYWTGYFTSRPTFKGMIRKASQILQLSKQLDAIGNLGPEDDSDVLISRKASALCQHHDAVTGTAKENVTRDYAKQLHRGISEVETVISDYMAKTQVTTDGFKICHLINETICEHSKSAQFSATVFNSNSKIYKGPIRIPVWSQKLGLVNSKDVNFEVVKTFNIDTLKDRNRAPYELHVYLEVPALGFTTINVTKTSNTENYLSKNSVKEVKKNKIENQYLLVKFDDSGLVESVYDKETGEMHKLQQKFLYYEGTNSNDSQPSGAYIFRPSNQNPIEFRDRIKVEIVQGNVIAEARQIISPWVFQTIRLPATKKYIEFEWTVGPIPKEDRNPITKEIVTRFITGIKNEQVFYTDSNGRQVLRRKNREATSFVYSNDEPVAGNYYPITSFGYIKDSRNQFSILTDRAQGMTSGSDGVVDIMIHRRCFYDDHFGVEEALDEPGKNGKGLVATGKHTVFFGNLKDSADMLRPLVLEKFHEPLIAFGANFGASKYSGLNKDLPAWFNLLTLERWNGKKLLMRVEHIFHNSDNLSKYANTQSFQLENIFTNFNILHARQLQLGANRNTTSSEKTDDGYYYIHPSEILTFELDVEFVKF